MKNIIWVLEEKYDSTCNWEPIDFFSNRKSARDYKKASLKFSKYEKYRIVKYVSLGVAE